MDEKPGDVLTIEELADYLKIPTLGLLNEGSVLLVVVHDLPLVLWFRMIIRWCAMRVQAFLQKNKKIATTRVATRDYDSAVMDTGPVGAYNMM